MALTQTKIDNAVLIGKSAALRLANELAQEIKYGGKLGCCICSLQLLYLWTNTLACITVDEEGEITGCLTEAQVLELIEKLRSMCTIENNIHL